MDNESNNCDLKYVTRRSVWGITVSARHGQVTVTEKNRTWKLLSARPRSLSISITIMNSTLCLSLYDCDFCVSSNQRSHIVHRDETIKTLSTHPPHRQLTPLTRKSSRKRPKLVCRNNSSFGIYIFIISVSYRSSLTRDLDDRVSLKTEGDRPLVFCSEIPNNNINNNLKVFIVVCHT